ACKPAHRPNSSGAIKIATVKACGRCGKPMQTAAEIAPVGNGPGLRAFRCPACGAQDSLLVEPVKRNAGDGSGALRNQTQNFGSCPAETAAGIGRSSPNATA